MTSRCRLLLVDDSSRMRRTIREIVGDLADAIEECSDGDEVLAAFDRFDPDWVFMDVRMGRLDGIQATRLLKQVHPRARVAIVTDFDHPDLRRRAREVGADAYVGKSDLARLRDLIRSIA